MDIPHYETALIVGAGEGISASLARLLARQGLRVALAARNAGKPAQAIEMRLDMAVQRFRQMDAQQVAQRRIGAIEIHAGRIGRNQIGGERGADLALGVHDDLLFMWLAFPSASCAWRAAE